MAAGPPVALSKPRPERNPMPLSPPSLSLSLPNKMSPRTEMPGPPNSAALTPCQWSPFATLYFSCHCPHPVPRMPLQTHTSVLSSLFTAPNIFFQLLLPQIQLQTLTSILPRRSSPALSPSFGGKHCCFLHGPTPHPHPVKSRCSGSTLPYCLPCHRSYLSPTFCS